MPHFSFVRCAQAGFAAACIGVSLHALAADPPKPVAKAAVKKAPAAKPAAPPGYKPGAPLPIATPEQIAPFAVYLASDEAAVATGGVYPIDSGYMAFKAQIDVMGTMQVD